jgi:hypothetical protein
MGVPPDDPSVDLRFLNDPTETEEQRQAFLAGAIHYAWRACALADELLEQREGQAWSKSRRGDGLPRWPRRPRPTPAPADQGDHGPQHERPHLARLHDAILPRRHSPGRVVMREVDLHPWPRATG